MKNYSGEYSLVNEEQLQSPPDGLHGQVFTTCSRVTLVTAYYKVPSKHSHTEFLGWMEGLLQTKDNLVIFTEEWFIPVMETVMVSMKNIVRKISNAY